MRLGITAEAAADAWDALLCQLLSTVPAPLGACMQADSLPPGVLCAGSHAYRGNSVDVLRTIPSRAIELSCYEWYKRVLRCGKLLRLSRACPHQHMQACAGLQAAWGHTLV